MRFENEWLLELELTMSEIPMNLTIPKLKERIMEIITLVEQQVCKGAKHSKICQELTYLWRYVDNYEDDLNERLKELSPSSILDVSEIQFIWELLEIRK